MICYFQVAKAKIVGHKFVGRSIKFNIQWTAGDHIWEPYNTVKDLEALDKYYTLMGVTHWQSGELTIHRFC
jgi:hypothetical protein